MILLLALLSFDSPLSGLAQDKQDSSAKIAQEIEYANAKDKPQFHVQAVRKLRDRGGPAVADEITRFVAARGHNALSIAFTEGLGDLQDARIHALLQTLVRDKDFLWRPTAMRALAQQADRDSLDDFRKGLGDKLWGCRAASVVALEKLKDRESLDAISEELAAGDDEPGLCALAFDQRVDGDGRAMNELLYRGGRKPALADAVDDALSKLRGSGEALGLHEPPRRLVEPDEIGESASDVDRDGDHASQLRRFGAWRACRT